ncbi:MAG: DnaA/Hda family protein [Thermodesulfobacteriota bacterium]
MDAKPKQPELRDLPDFLQFSVRKGIVDERTAHRIELYRRIRGLGKYESRTALMNDPVDPNLTFENYVVCKGNSFAVELAKTVAHKTATRLPYNPLYLYGDIGLGKTHLLSAIANAAIEKDVLLVNTADLDRELERAERLKCRAELTEWLVSVEILLVDDIQLCEGRENLQRDLFSVLNHMTRAHRWVVICSDVPPTRLAGVESRLLSRLGGGVIVSLQMGDRTERRDLIRHFMGERSFPQDVVDYLAENITDNVRRLKAAVAQLLALVDGMGNPLDVDLARAVVPLQRESPPPEKPSSTVSKGDVSNKPQPAPPPPSRANRFREMLASADSEEEQVLALQIALGERIRELRNEGADQKSLRQLERALELLRDGNMEEAIKCISN